MKKLFLALMFSFFALTCYSQRSLEDFGYNYSFEIVGKGNSGQYKCSGNIYEDKGSITVWLSDMLQKTYRVYRREQVDEVTIRLICRDSTLEDLAANGIKEYIIYKQKCTIGKNVYFFTIPPMYNGQGRTTYKVVRTR